MVEITGLFSVGLIDLTAFSNKISKPVVVITVRADRRLYAVRSFDLVICCNDLFCTFDQPLQNCTACVVNEVLRVVLNIRCSLNLCVERNNDQSPPCTIIACTDFREVICVKDKRVGRLEIERGFELLLGKNRIRTAKLFYHGGVQPHAFL